MIQPGAPRLGWAWVVVVLFTASGVLHLVRPSAFEAQVPDFLPLQTAVVVVSGVLELACAALLLLPRTRRLGGLAAALLLVAVFPGNLWQSWEAWQDHQAGEASTAYLVGTLVRLPLQLPLVWWTWRLWRGRRG
ncbi:MauE/DoxX family redox-associated membrane protein [Nocardioides aurantiacus]|uniref:Putative membrane protein n=1 Tax=Nocardioides aurantiacus TaxID=86796 RepID=A0A3N2CY37_9ACTN|nr:MauE/DoxX family redox-associated membrane protein [Nocardioides aurantiacus]ROR92455.1 putative membrane protein [Nocardioides aurantiacus]